MSPDKNLPPASSHPDFEEFVSVLGGFLNKQVSSGDEDYYRFLGFFCRWIGAREGQFLKLNPQGALTSVLSLSLGPDFDRGFNAAMSKGSSGQTPMDHALRQKEVIALVDIAKDPDLPPWFKDMMARHKLASMVAVPLLGRGQADSVLCAYYRDVCLFDQGTLHNLMMVGRMMGAALDNTPDSSGPDQAAQRLEILGSFLDYLRSESFTEENLYPQLASYAKKAVSLDKVFCGPIEKTGGGWTLSLVGISGGASSPVTKQLPVSPKIMEIILGLMEGGDPAARLEGWDELKIFTGVGSLNMVAAVIGKKTQPLGLLLGWRLEGEPIRPHEADIFRHLANAAAAIL